MTVHVVGAGLAGLAAATAMAETGAPVEVWEAAPHAGGRCRSYFDPQLGQVIDNGNHLLLSGNRAAMAYLRRLGAEASLAGPSGPCFPFFDLATGERWTLRPNLGPIPWWILFKGRGVAGARLGDYAALAPLLGPTRRGRVDEIVSTEGPAWTRLMHPFLVAALNLEPAGASAELASRVVRETLAKGGRAYAPRVPARTLAATFVEPAQAYLAQRGVAVRTQRRLVALNCDGERVVRLGFADGDVQIGPSDSVVLAVPPWVAAELLPGLPVPDAFEAIVNGHFAARAPTGAPLVTGVLGGLVQWIFSFEDRISVTVSAANGVVDQSRETLARTLWAETARVLGLGPELPPWQVVKERRATFAATPEQQARRPGPLTRLGNLALAGDWTDTGLPATIEGAVRSGFRAAELVRHGKVG
jgi:squalene-associated FAD-dependent desaturase